MESAIPNIFAPGSGGNNPLFYIPQIRGIEKVNYIRIFDRWAENVYNGIALMPGDASTGWDGNFRGKQANTGVYVVFVELTLANGTIWTYQGDLVLLR
ncbi:MAG: gliding motility-associated C-terminal domain-containing protein [Saprospiraceae bacterium]|nr:gliding motility-associated C-terminal domain-containing protein [Saprospiraceae bacterium]